MQEQPGYGFRFACRRSGNCCAVPGGIVQVTAADVAAIAAHLGMDEAGFKSRFVHPDGTRLVDGFANRCVFLQDGREATCGIYAVRPQRCRDWPFWPELRDPERLRAARRLCPGIEPLSRDDARS